MIQTGFQIEDFHYLEGNKFILEFINMGYLVSKEGVVTKKDKILKGFNNRGYHRLSLSHKGKPIKYSIHRLVAAAFIPNPENKKEVNHINGIKDDNRVENLEWATQSENMQHGYKIGLCRNGRTLNDYRKSNKSILQYDKQKKFIAEYPTIGAASRFIGIKNCSTSISRCANGGRPSAYGFIWKFKKDITL